MEIRKIEAVAVCPMSDCIKASWIFRVCDYVKEDYFSNALGIGAFPFFNIRPFLRNDIGNEVDDLDKALDTLKMPYQGLSLTIGKIHKVLVNAFKVVEDKMRSGILLPPILNASIHLVFICPVIANWFIDGEIGYGEPFATSNGKFTLIFCKPPEIKTKKEMDVWCKRIAGAITRGIAVNHGVNIYSSAWEIEEYRSKSLSEIEDLIRKERGWFPTPLSKAIIAENIVNEYFSKQEWAKLLLGNEGKSLDERGIDFTLVRFSRGKIIFATVQVESSLTFSKMKKFNQNSEKLFIEVLKPQKKDAHLKKYYITKEFDGKSKNFAKENGISLITFKEIAKTLPQRKMVLKEQKLI